MSEVIYEKVSLGVWKLTPAMVERLRKAGYTVKKVQ